VMVLVTGVMENMKMASTAASNGSPATSPTQ